MRAGLAILALVLIMAAEVWIYFFADSAAYRFWVMDALEWLAPTGTD